MVRMACLLFFELNVKVLKFYSDVMVIFLQQIMSFFDVFVPLLQINIIMVLAFDDILITFADVH